MATFKLKIETGNDAMRTGEDLARALRRIAKSIDEIGEIEPADAYSEASGRVLDDNGNVVGEWTLK